MLTQLFVSGADVSARQAGAPRSTMASLFAAVFIAGTICSGSAIAHDYTLGTLHIDHPYSRPTPPGARVGAAYFTIQNNGKDADRLVSVKSPVASQVELHSMNTRGNMMKMRPVEAIDLPAGSTVTLGRGGYHVMLQELHHPLSLGAEVPLTLTFEKAGSIDVSAHVEAAEPGAATQAAHPHQDVTSPK